MKAKVLFLVACVNNIMITSAEMECPKECPCNSKSNQENETLYDLQDRCQKHCMCLSNGDFNFNSVHHKREINAENRCPGTCKCNFTNNGVEVICKHENVDIRSQIIPRLPENTVSLVYGNTHHAYMTRQTFKHLEQLKLKNLSLYNNRIRKVSNDAFAGMTSLEFLEISEERFLVKDLLSKALNSVNRHIKKIRMSANSWDEPPNLTGLRSTRIREIDLTLNNFRTFSGSWFSGIHTLRTIRMMVNSINENNYNFTGIEKVEALYFGNNLFQIFPMFCPYRFENLLKLDMKNNKLLFLVADHFKCLPNLTDLNLDGNPIVKLFDDMFAGLPALKHLDLSYLAAELYKFEPSVFNSSSLKHLRMIENGIIFSNSFGGSRDIFSQCKQLEVLDISGNIMKLSEEDMISLFQPLKNLTVLYMKNMKMDILPKYFLLNVPKLAILDVSDNSLQGLWNGESVFGNKSHLKELYISKNKITSITPTAFPERFLNSLNRLDVGKNTFSCSCDDAKWFYLWMQKNKEILAPTINEITCTTLFPGKALVNLTESEFCPIDDAYIIAISVFGGLIAILFVSLALLYKMRWHIRYFLYKIKVRRKGYETVVGDLEFQYDIFLNFADEDRHFVLETMVPYFENYGYRLCIRYRDFEVGNFHIDNIVENLNRSRLVLLVLSNNFAKSPWCEFQLQVAYNRCLEEKKNNVIVTVLAEISYKYLTNTLRVLLTSHEYAMWSNDEAGKRLFWEKVFFKISLPEYTRKEETLELNVTSYI